MHTANSKRFREKVCNEHQSASSSGNASANLRRTPTKSGPLYVKFLNALRLLSFKTRSSCNITSFVRIGFSVPSTPAGPASPSLLSSCRPGTHGAFIKCTLSKSIFAPRKNAWFRTSRLNTCIRWNAVIFSPCWVARSISQVGVRRREESEIRSPRMRLFTRAETRGSMGISRVCIQSMMTFWVARRVLAQKGG